MEIVKNYQYLRNTLQVTGHTFSKHMEDRAVRAMKATVEIKKLNLLSIATALKLFTIKVAPIAIYGIQLIHELQTTRRG